MEKEISNDWKLIKLSDACNIIMGQSPPSETYNSNGIGMPFFQGKAEFTDLYPIVEKWCNVPKKIAEPNDILLSVRAPVGTTNIANQKCCIGRGLAALRFENYKYGFYFLRSKQQELDSKGTGTTFRAISGETIRETLIPFPSAKTQQAIVSKIEELFSELDNGIYNLKTAQLQLKTYRQSVLKWAFEGKLTNKKVKEGELPKGWKNVELKEVVTLSAQKHKPTKSENLFYVGLEHIEKHTGKLTSTVGVEKITTIKNKFYKDDILYGKLRPNLNKCYLAKEEGVCSTDILVLKLSTECLGKYLHPIMLSTGFVNQMSENTSGVNLPRVSTKFILEYKIPLPPVEEQDRIIQEIESRLSVADKMEESINQSLQQAEALRQSILKKAFEGKLI